MSSPASSPARVLEPDLLCLTAAPTTEGFDPGEARWRLAYHEAAHAVVAHSLGWRLVSVAIEEREGCCTSRPNLWVRPRPLTPEELASERRRAEATTRWADVTITLSGLAAEWLATGSVHPQALPEREKAIRIARAHGEEEWESCLRLCWANAHRCLREHWRAVEAVADALLRRRHLDGEEARTLIEAALATERELAS